MLDTKYTYSDEIYSDLHKDARGFRPGESGYTYWDSLSPDQKQSQWDSLVAEMNESERRQKESEARAVKAFEERIAMVIASGAKDRETAIRWIFQAENDEYVFGDPDYFCYNYGLPYGYFKKVA